MFHPGLLSSYLSWWELKIIVNGYVTILFVLRYMKFISLTTKTILIKPYTICSSHQLGLEVERPEWSTTFSFFAINNCTG